MNNISFIDNFSTLCYYWQAVNTGIIFAVAAVSIIHIQSREMIERVLFFLLIRSMAGQQQGNDGQDACEYSPAGAENPISVGATTIQDARAEFSNVGPCVDVFAPGKFMVAANNHALYIHESVCVPVSASIYV